MLRIGGFLETLPKANFLKIDILDWILDNDTKIVAPFRLIFKLFPTICRIWFSEFSDV